MADFVPYPGFNHSANLAVGLELASGYDATLFTYFVLALFTPRNCPMDAYPQRSRHRGPTAIASVTGEPPIFRSGPSAEVQSRKAHEDPLFGDHLLRQGTRPHG